MPSICWLHDLDNFPGFFFSPEVLGHQQIIGFQIPPFCMANFHKHLFEITFISQPRDKKHLFVLGREYIYSPHTTHIFFDLVFKLCTLQKCLF